MASLRLPFIVTVSVSTACGGAAVVDPASTSSGAGGSGATGGTSNPTTSGSGGTSNPTTSGSGGYGGNSSACPAEPPGDGYGQCSIPKGESCSYEIECQSGPVSLTFACDGVWQLAPQSCDLPYDSCPGTSYHCDGEWWMPTATNPPSPCPPELPAAGSECFAGGMGGVWEKCGYGDAACWVIATCAYGPSGGGKWEYGGCPPI